MSYSKSISKNDAEAKDFIRALLGSSTTRGFDVECLYCAVEEKRIQWTIVEFLKCDTVPPEVSHPKYYLNKNWRKFLSLWTLCLALRQQQSSHCKLLLVNYRDTTSKVKRMEVQDVSKERIVTSDEVTMTFDEAQGWFREINDNKPGETWDAISILLDSREGQAPPGSNPAGRAGA